MEIVIHVEGMMCKHCAARVEKACLAVAETTGAEVNLQEKTVTVRGNAGREVYEKAITDAGYQVKE